MLFKSDLTGKSYCAEEVIFIENIKQGTRYWINNVLPIDIKVYRDEDDIEKVKMVFVFRKEDSQKVYRLWKNHELL